MVFLSVRCNSFNMEPSSGYLNPKLFKAEHMGGEKIPTKNNLARVIERDTVWHLMDLASGTSPGDSFSRVLGEAEARGEREAVEALVRGASGLSDDSVINVCRLCRRECRELLPTSADPDGATISQMREMAERGGRFLRTHGPKTASGFSFGQGYADDLVADPWVFTTEDTLWVLDASPSLTKNTAMGALVHYLVGRRFSPEIGAVKRLGVYNPRLDAAYTIAVADVPPRVVASAEREYVETALSYRKPGRPESPSTTIVKAIGKIILWLILIGIGFIGVLTILACLRSGPRHRPGRVLEGLQTRSLRRSNGRALQPRRRTAPPSPKSPANQ